MGVGATVREHQVDVRIAPSGVGAAANYDKRTIFAALIAEVMAVRRALGPGGAVANLEHCPAVILDEHRFPLKHDEELILPIMPVTLGRPGPRFQNDVADAKFGEAGDRSEPAIPAPGDLLVERRRIAGAVDLFDGVKVDLGHDRPNSRTAAA